MGRKSKYCVFHSLEGSGNQLRNDEVCGDNVSEENDGKQRKKKKRRKQNEDESTEQLTSDTNNVKVI